METEESELTRATAEPNIKALQEEFRCCNPWAVGGFHRLSTADDVRYMRWPGQSCDGKKHSCNLPDGVDAFPWEGASDAQVPTVDEVISEAVSLEMVALWRAVPEAQAIETSDLEATAYANTLINWLVRTKQRDQMRTEGERFSNYVYTYGWAVLYVTWDRVNQLRRVPVTWEKLAGMLGGPDSPDFKMIAGVIVDPDEEDSAVLLLQRVAPSVNEKKLRTAIRELREKGETELALPYVCKDQPSIRALKPWEEVLIPPWMSDIQGGPVFVRRFFTEVDLWEKVYTENWNKEWVERAVKTKGQVSCWSCTHDSWSGGAIVKGGTMYSTYATQQIQTPLIEVLYSYVRQADEDNVQGIYLTIFSPHIGLEGTEVGQADYAKHELLDYEHGQMPFVVRRREEVSTLITESRGVPEMLYTAQRLIKVQEDAVTDLTSVAVLPPLLDYEIDGTSYQLGPAKTIPVTSAGREPRFMEIPTHGGSLAFNMIEWLQKRVDRYMGRRRPDLDPVTADARQQWSIMANHSAWMQAFQQEFALMQQYFPAEKIQRITGGQIPQDYWSIHEEADVMLSFDIRELNPDFVKMKAEMIRTAVLPVDSAGVIDPSRLVVTMLRAIDPNLARSIVRPPEQAQQQIVNKVRDDLTLIAAGFEPDYVENDPTAALKLNTMHQLLRSNPQMMKQTFNSKQTQLLLKNYEANLMQSVVQQQNEQVGRTGVKALQPVSMFGEGNGAMETPMAQEMMGAPAGAGAPMGAGY